MSPVASAWGCWGGAAVNVAGLGWWGLCPLCSPEGSVAPEDTQTQQEQNERSLGRGHWDHTCNQPWEVGRSRPKPGRVPPAS